MGKTTNNFNRLFSTLVRNDPIIFEDLEDVGDGYPGLQYMTNKTLGGYSPYRVIDGIDIIIDGYDVTGTSGYAVLDGEIREIKTNGYATLANEYYFILNKDRTFTTSQTPTGLVLAHRQDANVWDVTRREDVNSKVYYPNELHIYDRLYVKENGIEASGAFHLSGDIDSTIIANANIDSDVVGKVDIIGAITGHTTSNISGFNIVSAETGSYKDIKGFDDTIDITLLSLPTHTI